MFLLPGLYCKKFLCILASPLPLQNSPSEPSGRLVSWAWSPQKCPPNKTISQLLGCTFFFSGPSEKLAFWKTVPVRLGQWFTFIRNALLIFPQVFSLWFSVRKLKMSDCNFLKYKLVISLLQKWTSSHPSFLSRIFTLWEVIWLLLLLPTKSPQWFVSKKFQSWNIKRIN